MTSNSRSSFFLKYSVILFSLAHCIHRILKSQIHHDYKRYYTTNTYSNKASFHPITQKRLDENWDNSDNEPSATPSQREHYEEGNGVIIN